MDRADYEATILEHINIDYDARLAVANAVEDLRYAVKNHHEFDRVEMEKINFALSLIKGISR